MATCTDAEACAARLLLGLPAEEMNFDRIRKAYLKASLRYHPDKAARHGFTEAEATDAMQRIAHAFGQLGGDNGAVELVFVGPMTWWDWAARFQNCPAAVLGVVCEFVSYWRDIHRVTGVCRRMREGGVFVTPRARAEWEHMNAFSPSLCRRRGAGMHALHLNRAPVAGASLSALAACARLGTLDLSCTAVRDVGALGACPALALLKLSECDDLESLSGLECAPRLRSLDLSGTPVVEVGCLGRSASLEVLDLSGCKQVRMCVRVRVCVCVLDGGWRVGVGGALWVLSASQARLRRFLKYDLTLLCLSPCPEV